MTKDSYFLIFLSLLFSCVSSGEGCTYGSLRLVGGSTSYEGRLEICINNVWGTVCDDYFTNTNARVVCRQLGYNTTSATYHSNAYYGAGSGNILLDNVQCSTGYESSLLSCNHNNIGNNDCTHSEDVGVSCPGSNSACTYGSLRLVGGSTSNQGRLEICINNVWGTVCDDDWTNTNARVACRQLGYSTTGAIYHSRAYYGAGSGNILLDNVQCSTGTESSLLSCSRNAIGNNDCTHSEDVGVSCPGNISNSCTYGSLRLVGGSTQGRLEICINNVWGTVCDDGFTNTNARVVCRQLGYSTTGAIYRSSAYYGRGNGSILLDDVRCTGSESSLLSCTHSTIGIHNCGHSEDVSVQCSSGVSSICTYGSLRLVGGSAVDQGRVEICINNTWGTVCDDGFTNTNARVVCRQLGYSTTNAIYRSSAYYGSGSGNIWLDDVSCTGSESSLLQCTHDPIGTSNCGHSEDVSVRCSSSSSVSATAGSIGGTVTIIVIIIFVIALSSCGYRRRRYYHRNRGPRSVFVTSGRTQAAAVTVTTQATTSTASSAYPQQEKSSYPTQGGAPYTVTQTTPQQPPAAYPAQGTGFRTEEPPPYAAATAPGYASPYPVQPNAPGYPAYPYPSQYPQDPAYPPPPPQDVPYPVQTGYPSAAYPPPVQGGPMPPYPS